MVKPVVRRQVDPQIILKFWDAINFIRQQKQISNEDRVQRFMKRNSDLTPSDCNIQLQRAVEDELIIRYTAVGFKGSKVGMEQDGFKIPDPDDSEWERGDYDWYCFDCHQPGEVVKCSDCWRVYHPTCTEEDWTGTKFICSVCQTIKKTPRMKRKEVNKLLSYTVIRLKDKTKELHKFGKAEDELKVERMVYKYMDLNTMEEKCAARKYKYLEQFYADARTILHNTFITYGDTGVMADLAKIMIRDCKYDLDEVRQCKDCYQYSNSKPREWFCQPCRPPHELVYAKQKGFSFWPAKVIKVTPEGYDVRFFGGWHQRAIISETSVKPIHCSMKELGIKRTAGFAKASQELALHQELIEKARAAVERGDPEEQDEEEEEFEEPEPEPVPHKKFRKRHREDREEVITSSNTMADNLAGTPEDANLVTSSEDTHIHAGPRTFSTADIGVQTSKKLSHPGKMPHKSTQTDTEVAATNCNCDSKYNKIFADFKQRMENDHKVDQTRSLKDLEERLQSDFETEKEQAVNRAMSNLQREADRVKRQTEDRLREQHAEEIKKLTQKHKAEVSTTKKKQWCYNCEEEAMYHCCWNTSYCSIKCQQDHWHREHKRMCRRKRN